MAAPNAVFANGESLLPQTRPAATVEWAYANGESGGLPAPQVTAAAASGAADRGMPRGMGRGLHRGLAAHHMTKQNGIWQPRERRLIVPVGVTFCPQGD